MRIIIIAAHCLFWSSVGLAAGRFGSKGSDSAGGSSGGAFQSIANTQSQRSAERFDILSWVRGNQAKVSEQNRRWGNGSGPSSGIFLDFTMTYFSEGGLVERQFEGSSTRTKIGTEILQKGRLQLYINSLFQSGNRSALLNLDLGLEAFGSQLSNFTQPKDAPPVQLERSYSDYGGGLLLRPLGRSSQDSGLAIKGGYVTSSSKGFFTTNHLLQAKTSSYYLGAEAKLYLLPFLGLAGEYTNIPETAVSGDLKGKFSLSRFRYGAFLEIFLLNVGVYLVNQEITYTDDNTGLKNKDYYPAQGLTASLHF